jgi:hypothetical protein
MPKLPGIRHKDEIRVLEKVGWRVIREGKHTIMAKEGEIIPIPAARPDPRDHNGTDRKGGRTYSRRLSRIALRFVDGRAAPTG